MELLLGLSRDSAIVVEINVQIDIDGLGGRSGVGRSERRTGVARELVSVGG